MPLYQREGVCWRVIGTSTATAAAFTLVLALLSSITILLLSTLAFGQEPNTFSSGETISSSKINANFAYLANGILKDNVIAMMVCQAEGFTESGVYYYASCYSSDDQTF